MAPVAGTPMDPIAMMVLRASLTSMDAQRNTNVNAFLLLRSWNPTIIEVFFNVGFSKVDLAKSYRRFRSPRRLDKIHGERDEGLSCV